MIQGEYVCFVALREEMAYVHQAMLALGAKETGPPYHEGATHQMYVITDTRTRARMMITFVISGQMGQLSSALLAIDEVRKRRFQAAFILGIAGTLHPGEFRLGDVVVSGSAKFLGIDAVKPYPEGGLQDGERQPIEMNEMKRLGAKAWLRVRRDYVSHSQSEQVLSRYVANMMNGAPPGLRSVPPDGLPEALAVTGPPRVHHGIVLGSEWVVDSPEWAAFLIERNDRPTDDYYRRKGDLESLSRTRWMAGRIACVDMETFGFLKAAERVERDMIRIAVRGISDPCSGKAGLEAETSNGVRTIAAANAAAVLVDLAVNLMNNDYRLQ